MNAVLNIFKVSDLRKKILYTLWLVLVFRFVAHVRVPGIDVEALEQLFSQNQLLGLLNLFTGNTLSQFSIVTLGLNPYINASIILQLLTMVFPALEELSKEGEQGRQKINQYTRILSIPLAAVQALGMYVLFRNQNIIGTLSMPALVALITTMIAGTVFLMWLGELITEDGVGNGISVMILVGILSGLPQSLGQIVASQTAANISNLLLFVVVSLAVIALIVVMNEAQRRVPVQYAKRVRGNRVYGGQSTHIPLRVNQAGVIPIIFAVSLIVIPGMAGNFLSQMSQPKLAELGVWLTQTFSNNALYSIIYFVLVVAFTFFYTGVTFNPQKISEDIKKNGGFVPGIRPGQATASYLSYILYRITVVGALFLGFVAVLPFIMQSTTGVQAFAIGGTSILIIVSVILEVSKQLQSMLLTRQYEGFLE